MVDGKSQSLASGRRKSITEAYRSRGRSNSNLWLVYSIKTDRDYIFPSDRQLIHWLYFLESNPEVKSFEIEPPAIMSVDAFETRATELDAKAFFVDGRIEWHEVKSEDNELSPGKSQLQAQAAAASTEGVTYRTFSDKDISPHVRVSLRWLKAIGFAAVLRERSFSQETLALNRTIRGMCSGTVDDILQANFEFDPMIIKGLVVRQENFL